MGRICKLSWFARKIKDYWKSGNYTRLELMVPAPTRDDPIPCILVSIRNGFRKLFFRVPDLATYDEAFKLPQEARDRITNALIEANAQAAQMVEDERLIYLRRSGIGLVRMDTGEIVSEAERILDAH